MCKCPQCGWNFEASDLVEIQCYCGKVIDVQKKEGEHEPKTN
jgi:hypothetical protein